MQEKILNCMMGVIAKDHMKMEHLFKNMIQKMKIMMNLKVNLMLVMKKMNLIIMSMKGIINQIMMMKEIMILIMMKMKMKMVGNYMKKILMNLLGTKVQLAKIIIYCLMKV